MSTGTDVRFTRCKGNYFCPGLERVLESDHHKGLVTLQFYNGVTHSLWEAVAYKTSATHRGVILNYCPFCGHRLFDDSRATEIQIHPAGAKPKEAGR